LICPPINQRDSRTANERRSSIDLRALAHAAELAGTDLPRPHKASGQLCLRLLDSDRRQKYLGLRNISLARRRDPVTHAGTLTPPDYEPNAMSRSFAAFSRSKVRRINGFTGGELAELRRSAIPWLALRSDGPMP
jgi:hypothetical protein